VSQVGWAAVRLWKTTIEKMSREQQREIGKERYGVFDYSLFYSNGNPTTCIAVCVLLGLMTIPPSVLVDNMWYGIASIGCDDAGCFLRSLGG
jgi:hypothetical protein